jgi:hypothetical protein
MTTTRLTVEERRGFARYAREMDGPTATRSYRVKHTPDEPALGTLDERLAILVKRLGGRVGPVKLTAAERAELRAYQDQELAA